MRRARAIVGACALALGIAACQLIAGIKDRPYDAPAPSASAPVDAPSGPPADPCMHAVPPSPPDGSIGTNAPMYVFAIRTVDFSSTVDGGTSHVGFDLDGVCTCDSRPGSAHGGASSCVLPKDAPPPPGCDFDGGIDNSAAPFLQPLIESPAFAGVVQTIGELARCGKQSVLISVSGYNGLADDPDVFVGIVPAGGILTPTDGGAMNDAGCGATGDGGAYAPAWNGEDEWSVPADGFVSLRPGDPLIPTIQVKAYVRDYQVVVNEPNMAVDPGHLPTGPAKLSFPLIATATLVIHAPVLVMQLTPIADDGGPPHGFLAAGTIAGRVSTHEALSTVGSVQARVGTGNTTDYVCQALGGSIYARLKKQLCQLADLATDPVNDFAANEACDAISIALRFTAEPAKIGAPVYDPPSSDGGDGGCGPGFQDWCDAGF